LLWDGQSRDRNPVGERFSTPIQTGSEVHPAPCTNNTRNVPAVQRPGCGVDHPSPSNAKVKETVELYIYEACPESKDTSRVGQ